MRAIIKAGVRIALVAMALYFLYTAFINTGHNILSLALYGDTDFSPVTLMIIVIILAVLIVIAILWWKTDWLVGLITGKNGENELVITTSNLDLFRVAICILGIYLLVTAISGLIGNTVYYLGLPDTFDDYLQQEYQLRALQTIVMRVITILISLWLVFGSRGISNIVEKVMNVPITEVKDE